MLKVGAYEAKTKLSSLLDRVSKGETVLITRHGVPIAVIKPPDGFSARPTSEVIKGIEELAKKSRLGKGTSIKDLVENGRRF